jgi:2-isopropylmalate synthase
MFQETYLADDGLTLVEYRTLPDAEGRLLTATIRVDGKERAIEGRGNGPVDAFVDALKKAGIADLAVEDYREHALGAGANAKAAAYVEAKTPDGRTLFGVGVDRSIVEASLRAVTSAAARAGHTR